jgi:hypothetical protein
MVCQVDERSRKVELSVYLARVWGLGSVLTCAGLLLNQTSFINMMEHIQADSISILIAGILALGIGVVQVAGFNSWTADYRGLITFFGWVSLLKGIAIIFVPGYLVTFAHVLIKGPWYMALVGLWFIASVYLCYAGFAKRRTTEHLPVHHA